MKAIFKSILGCCALFLCTAPMTGCTDKDEDGSGARVGFREVVNPAEESQVSHYGETVTVSFTAEAGWDADLKTSDGGTWVEIISKKGGESGGKSSIQLSVGENEKDETRSVEVYVTVNGFSRGLLCTLTQASAAGAKVDQFLNAKMDERLKAEYLWNEAYNGLAEKNQLQFDLPYDDFLYTNLVKLGDTNIEDGGLYREYSANRGKRYIYSYINELGTPQVSASARPTRGYTMTGLGMGLTLSMMYDKETQTSCLSVGYVYLGSPAAEKGLRRGDMIFSVNGVRLTPNNYAAYQYELYTTTSGTYNFKYGRFKEDGRTLVEYETTVTAAGFDYNPILLAAQFLNPAGTVNIGYLVLETFDLSAQESLEFQLNDFAAKGIKDLILDLRFNPGGSVAQCRYLMSSIVGRAHYDDTFAKMTFNDGSEEVWSFGYGNPKEPDGLGQGPDLGLRRLYVICSENTGSASEIVINSLKGIDFEVTTYGSRTEGKNVGMVTSQIVYDGRRFEFAPITFWVKNAKGFGDYADGFEVDHMVNNQNSNWEDDIDTMFPYNPTDWGNRDADAALLWAVMNANGDGDPEFDDPTAEKSAFAKRRMQGVRMLPNTPVKAAFGRYGNVIYGSEVVEE